MDLLKGSLVRLKGMDPEAISQADARWSRHSEQFRLLGTEVARPFSLAQARKFFEKLVEREDHFLFQVHALDDDRLVGDIGLDGVNWVQGDSIVGISIYPPEWSKGYGTDAMRVILGYAFQVLNLRRVSLDVFSYNPRAVRSYEKAGFRHEGRLRNFLNRDGQRYDLIFMGILRTEWQDLAV